MHHPLLTTPKGIHQVLSGVMMPGAAKSKERLDTMLSFFWQTTENFQTFSQGLFFREEDRLVPAIHEATKALQEAILVTDCAFVDPLYLMYNDRTVMIDHKNVPCFLEKPDPVNPRESIRVYYNPSDHFFVAVAITYGGNEAPGPFAPGAESDFFRLQATPTQPDHIYETMTTVLTRTMEVPPGALDVYRPSH